MHSGQDQIVVGFTTPQCVFVYFISNVISWNPTNSWQDILCKIVWDTVCRNILSCYVCTSLFTTYKWTDTLKLKYCWNIVLFPPTKVNLPLRLRLSKPILDILFWPFDLLLNYLVFQSFDFESTGWTLLQKRLVITKLDIHGFNNKYLVCIYNQQQQS